MSDRRLRAAGAWVLVMAVCGRMAWAAAPQPDPASVQIKAATVPFSSFASPQARSAFIAARKQPPDPNFGTNVTALRQFHSKSTDKILAVMKRLYGTDISGEALGGVRVDVVVPSAGIAPQNRDRVLIELHSGGFLWGAGSEALLEAIPIAAIGRIKVVSVDYRMAPEHAFPAASEDVAAVYQALLKQFRPQDVGIYGCSAGGILAAESAAWFAVHHIPQPGAIASLCGTGAELQGDSGYLAPALLGTGGIPVGGKPLLLADLPYFKGVSEQNPLAFPIVSARILKQFPPTLLIAGDRDFTESSETLMQRRLREAGAHSDLFIFDGLWHAFMMDPTLPESREVYGLVWRFFDEHLQGSRAEATGPSCTLDAVRSLVSTPVSIDTVSHVAGTAVIPAYCAVLGHIQHGTAIGFELGLPDSWNHKYLFYGIGGFAGKLDPILAGLAKGYASGTSDTGHVGTSVQDASWALHNPAGILNHFESGTALPASALKALTAAYYGHVPVHAYFQGCSAGGRQAVVEAERFPSTFDGVIAGAPAWDYTDLLVSFIENGKVILRSPANWIPPEDFGAIDHVVQAQCSVKAGDGTSDGLIVNPQRCQPNLQVLLCRKGTRRGPCLTQAQLATLREITAAGFARGAPGYSGYPLAGSASDAGLSWGWSKWFFGTLPPVADRQGRLDFHGDVLPQGGDVGQGPNQFLLGEQFLRYMVMGDTSYDARTFSFPRDAARLDRKLGGLLDATLTDLGPFVRLGGKLLIWHGWSDPAIPPQMSIALYQRIEQSTRGYEDQPGTRDSVRLFMVPGVQHCGGGTGLTDFDPLDALDRWVAQGQAPDRIAASQDVDGKSVRSRPLCPYPKAAYYSGRGDPGKASSFVCR